MTRARDDRDDRQTLDASTLDALLLEASAQMKAGLHLLDDDRPEAPAEALDCFDRALAVRRRLPFEEFPVLRYDLAACWLNRAEALVRLATGDSRDERIALALEAYAEAIALLREVPLDDDPRFPRRLAIACQNRGLLLHAQGAASAEAAIASLHEAIAVLDRHGSVVPDRQPLLATIWLNLANIQLLDGREPDEAWTQGRRAATEAIALIRDLETQDADAADIGLRARHVLCRALADTCLAGEPLTGAAADEVHEATDLAEEALALVQRWEHQGVPRFRALACDFFRFGAHVYSRYQPHFLQEFLHDQLNPAHAAPGYLESPEMQAAAADVAASLTHVTYYVTLTTDTN